MLTIKIDPCEEKEYWDDRLKQFITREAFKGCTLNLEHSLISISKWESKWHIPFLSSEKTEEQTIDYIKCMMINPGYSDSIIDYLNVEHVQMISDYINNPMTATSVIEKPGRKTGEIVTSELIYYWMIALQIPHEFEKWHLNRLLKLIEVCNVKNEPPKKMSAREIMERNQALNKARRAKYNTKG